MTPDKSSDQKDQPLIDIPPLIDRPPQSPQKNKACFYVFLICCYVICFVYILGLCSVILRHAETSIVSFEPTEKPSDPSIFSDEPTEKHYDPTIFSDEPSPYRTARINPNTSNVDAITKLSLHLKQNKVLVTSKTAQTLPLLVSLETQGLDNLYRPPLDLVCLVDITPSKIEFVKDTLKHLMSFMDDEDRISVVLCNDHALTIVPLTNTTEQNKDKILALSYIINSGNKSSLSQGFETAVKILNKKTSSLGQRFEAAKKVLNKETSNPVTAVLVISERLENQENWKFERTIKTFFKKRKYSSILTSVDGVGLDFFAPSFNGSIFFLDKLDSLQEAFAFVESLAVFQTSLTKNVEFFIETELADSKILKDSDTVKMQEDKSYSFNYGRFFMTQSSNLVTRRRQDAFFELKMSSFPEVVPNSPVEMTVASFSAIMTLPDGSQVIKKANLNVTFVQELEHEEDDKEMAKYYYRHKGAEMMEEARKLQYDRKHEEALGPLKKCKEFLENCGLRDDGIIQNMMKDIDESLEKGHLVEDFLLTDIPMNHIRYFVASL